MLYDALGLLFCKMSVMEREAALHFRDQLRAARAAALRDAEAFTDLVSVFERLGAHLSDKRVALGKYLKAISTLAKESPMAEDVPRNLPDYHQHFDVKYRIVQDARNAALHEGALARHLTINAVEMSLVLEEAIMKDRHQVSDYMVRNPVCASMWQPLSFIRQTMLVNSFSYLPVAVEKNGITEWQLLSDFRLAQCLRKNGPVTKEGLIRRLKDVVESKLIELHTATICRPQDEVETILPESNWLPALVLSSDNKELLGMLTPFDLL
jgi:hypothetical protein